MRKQYDLKFITPAFCSGADQSKAEIRVPSIIGELRWWFRVINGCDNENAVFGGIAGGKAIKSSITVRVSKKNIISNKDDLPSMKINHPLSYLLYYANASGKNRGDSFGPRFKTGGFISPGTTFTLSISERGKLSAPLRTQVQKALEAFLNFGSIGLRSTRACGAFVDENNILSYEEFKKQARCLNNLSVYWIVDRDGRQAYRDDWKSTLMLHESLLRRMRKQYPAGKNGENLTALGSSGNNREGVDRQRSAVKLRPVRLQEGILPVVIYSESVLDPQCGGIDCDGMEFNHPFDARNPQNGDLYSLV